MTDDEIRSPDYWTRQVRHTVRFAEAITWLHAHRTTTYLELGPHPVLGPAIEDTLASGADDVFGPTVVSGTMFRDHDDACQILTAAARLHTRGHDLDWEAVFAGTDARRVILPTYPFQHRDYWLHPTPDAHSVPPRLGQANATHRLLGAVVEQPDGAVVLTGRLSTQEHPWLADHAVAGAVMLPGTAFVELAAYAGRWVGCRTLDELTVRQPLVVPKRGAFQLRITVSPPNDAGHHPVSVHSRPDDGDNASNWTQHVEGTLVDTEPTAPAVPATWPPAGAVSLDVSGIYEQLASWGYDYGTTFQGMRAAWRHDNAVYAEISLPDETDVSGFLAHPALLDAAMHAGGLVENLSSRTRLPFAYTGVSIHDTHATEARVRLTPLDADRMSVAMFATTGRPIATVDTIALRPISDDSPTTGSATLFRLDWQRLADQRPPDRTTRIAVLGRDAAPTGTKLAADTHSIAYYPDLAALMADTTADAPDLVLVPCPHSATGAATDAEATRAVLADAITLTRAFLASESLASARLTLVTHGAVAVDTAEDIADLPAAAVWGMVRSVEWEEPGRVTVVDLDKSIEDSEATGALVRALMADESQLAVRSNTVLVPRLAPASSAPSLVRPQPDVGAWQQVVSARWRICLWCRHPTPAVLLRPARCGLRYARRA